MEGLHEETEQLQIFMKNKIHAFRSPSTLTTLQTWRTLLLWTLFMKAIQSFKQEFHVVEMEGMLKAIKTIQANIKDCSGQQISTTEDKIVGRRL